jgi:hypothetical protein
MRGRGGVRASFAWRAPVSEAWLESRTARLSLSPWYVAIFHDRPGQPLASRCRHKDRYCQHIGHIGDDDVREGNRGRIGAAGTVRYLRMSADFAASRPPARHA